MITQYYSDKWVAQLAIDYRTGSVFSRGKNNGTWKAWRRLAVSDDLVAKVDTTTYATDQTAINTAIDDLNTELANKVDKVSGKGLSTNDFTDALETKLSGIATGAEVNQNAFSNVKVGSTTIAADAKTDTLELAAGKDVTLTPDATNDKVTVVSNRYYAKCETAAATAAKVATALANTNALTSDNLTVGARIFVYFSNAVTVDNATLNVDGTGAKQIWYGTGRLGKNLLKAGHIYEFVLSSDPYWFVVGDIDTNSTYTAASAAPKAPGTAAVGTSSKYAREDHVHPLQTTINGHTVNKDVPSDAVFTDTTYTPASANPKAPGTVAVGTSVKYAREDHVHPLQTTVSGNAGTATELATPRNIDGVSFDGSSDIVHYGTASFTPQSTHVNVTVAGVTGFSKVTGARILVKFSHDSNLTGSYESASLLVGSLQGSPISVFGSTAFDINDYFNYNNLICEFVFTGTNFELVHGLDNDTTYTAGTGLSLSSNKFSLASGVITAGSAGPTAAVTGNEGNTIAVPRITVDTYGRVTELTSYNLTNKNTTYTNLTLGQGYGTCSTAAATVAKVGTLSGYALTTGGVVAIKFTYAVPASATLNINSKGAKAIYHKGAAIKANVIHAGDTATFLYDGSRYHLLAVDRATVTDVDDDYESTETITFPNGTMMQTGAYQFNFGSANYVDFTCTLNTPMSSTGYKVFFSATATNSTQALAPIFELKSKTTSNFVVRAWKNLSSTSTISDWCGWLAIGK